MPLDAADLEVITRTLIAPLVNELRVEIRAVATETRALRTEMTGEMRALRTEMTGETRALSTEMTGETRALRTEMNGGFARLSERIEHLILTTGEHWRDHERRLLRLERLRDGNGSGHGEDESGDE